MGFSLDFPAEKLVGRIISRRSCWHETLQILLDIGLDKPSNNFLFHLVIAKTEIFRFFISGK
jgi:hypothetical protein